jgi:hypothetical protein
MPWRDVIAGVQAEPHASNQNFKRLDSSDDNTSPGSTLLLTDSDTQKCYKSAHGQRNSLSDVCAGETFGEVVSILTFTATAHETTPLSTPRTSHDQIQHRGQCEFPSLYYTYIGYDIECDIDMGG